MRAYIAAPFCRVFSLKICNLLCNIFVKEIAIIAQSLMTLYYPLLKWLKIEFDEKKLVGLKPLYRPFRPQLFVYVTQASRPGL